MLRFTSRFRTRLLPRLAYTALALGSLTTASAQEQEIEGTGQSQSATVTLPAGGRVCLGAVKGQVFLRATGDASGRLSYFMRRSDTDAPGSFTRIPFSDITGARQYDFTVDSDNRPDLFPGFFKVCATNGTSASVRVKLTLFGE